MPRLSKEQIESLPVWPRDGEGSRNGMVASEHLAAWLRKLGLSCCPDFSAWRKIASNPSLLRVALARGYSHFLCKTHGKFYCPDCACPECRAAGGCNCLGREVAYTDPKLLSKSTRARRLGLELEVEFRNDEQLQVLLEEWPYCHEDGSLSDPAAELILASRSDKLLDLAATLHRVLAIPGMRATRRCGFHVHVERNASIRFPDSWNLPSNDVCLQADHRIVERWLAVQDSMYEIFPTRRSEGCCHRLEAAHIDRLFDHYSVLSYSDHHPTWEFRVHPGTTSWLASVCWTDWCASFAAVKTAKLGQHYVDARRATLRATDGRAAYPLAWTKVIDQHAAKYDIKSTLKAIADNAFAAFENHRTLRTSAREAHVPVAELSRLRDHRNSEV